MRDVLDAVAAGELSPEEAEAALAGYLTADAGRYDAAREHRRGIPEGILAEGKTPDEVANLSTSAINTTGRAIVTRVESRQLGALETAIEAMDGDVTMSTHDRANTVVAHASSFDPPSLDADVGIVTAGTADARVAGEAAVIAEEIGARVERIEDVGVANLTRVTDQLPTLRSYDVLVVAAGREGALPTVVAGLLDVPVIGLPVSTGYGRGGDGDAALLGMLQSCTTLSVVNVDAGFVAGAQAGLIARRIDAARRES